jgi:hypothetical protein
MKAWVESSERSPAVAQSEVALHELAQLLAMPSLEQLAREAREERMLTEHYAERAEGIDDPNVTPGERERRRAEFGSLRKRLGGQLVQGAGSGSDRTQRAGLLTHLVSLFERAPTPSSGKKQPKTRQPDYRPLLTRLHELRREKAPTP